MSIISKEILLKQKMALEDSMQRIQASLNELTLK